MKKYKVEIEETVRYCIDVEAKDEDEASELAQNKFYGEIADSGTAHYYQVGDTSSLVENIFDVTNTDDPFNP